MVRKALVVGVDYYPGFTSHLRTCVNDANKIAQLLARHHDGQVNFSPVHPRTASGPADELKADELLRRLKDLFSGDQIEVALFYFSGHGYRDGTGGFICCSDAEKDSGGLALDQVINLANASKAHHRIILFDSCHSGSAAEHAQFSESSTVHHGLTILTASTAAQTAHAAGGAGVFTSLLVHALEGGAANLLGQVTPGSIYAHIDQALSAHQQRPVFKTNVQRFVSLRSARPPIELQTLHRITKLFRAPGDVIDLDPSFEWTDSSANADNVEKFKVLQRYNRVNLLVPVGADDMYWAAIHHKKCRLTALGEHYWRLVNDEII